MLSSRSLSCLALFCLLCLALPAFAQDSVPAGKIQVTGKMSLVGDGSEVLVNRPFEVQVAITALGDDPDLKAQPPKIAWPSTLNVKHDASHQESRVKGKGERQQTEQVFIYKLQPTVQSGSITISAFPLTYHIRGEAEARTLVIPGLTLTVTDKKKISHSVKGLYWGIGAVVVVALCLVGYWFRRRSKRVAKKAAQALKKEDELPLEERPEGKFLRELASTQRLWLAGEEKKYYAAVEKLLLTFIQEKYRVGAHDDPKALTEELLESGMDPREAQRLVSLLETCREVEYSPQTPSSPEQYRFQRDLEEMVRFSDRKITNEPSQS